MKRLLAALLLAFPAVVAAQELRPLPWELRLDATADNLDNGQPDWREAGAQIAYRPTARQSMLVGYRTTERFDQRDREGFAAAYAPIPDASTTVHLEGSWSPTHRVLPHHVYLAEIIQPLGDGWVATAGGKDSRYATDKARSAWAVVEKYSGDFRYAYHLQITRVEGASWSPSHRFTASWYRSDLTYATVTATTGKEVENVYPEGLLQSDVRGLSLLGGWAIGPRWGVVMELGWTRQGDLYNRRTARLGTRFLF